MLSSKVALHNVKDAEALVHHCIRKAGIVITDDQREDLAAEGLVILCELARAYDPQRDPGSADPSKGFFGYALYLLPRKLGDAWHRSQEHHVLRTQPDGSRRYEYLRPAKSMGELTDDPQRDLHAGNCRTVGDFAPPTRRAA